MGFFSTCLVQRRVAVLLGLSSSRCYATSQEKSGTSGAEPDERRGGSISWSWSPGWSRSSSAADLSGYASSLSTKRGCSLHNEQGLSIVPQSGIMPPGLGEAVEFTHLLI